MNTKKILKSILEGANIREVLSYKDYDEKALFAEIEQAFKDRGYNFEVGRNFPNVAASLDDDFATVCYHGNNGSFIAIAIDLNAYLADPDKTLDEIIQSFEEAVREP